MTLNELKSLGRQLMSFLKLFSDCFASGPGRRLLAVYIQGQLSDVQRKNCEAIALKFDTPPRTLQPAFSCLRGSNRSSGMKNVCGSAVSRLWLPSIDTRKQLV